MNTIVEQYDEKAALANSPLRILTGPDNTAVSVRILSIAQAEAWCRRANVEIMLLARVANRAQEELAAADRAVSRSLEKEAGERRLVPESLGGPTGGDAAGDGGPTGGELAAEADRAYRRAADAADAYNAAAIGAVQEYLDLAGVQYDVRQSTPGQVLDAFAALFQLTDPTRVSQLSRLRDARKVLDGATAKK